MTKREQIENHIKLLENEIPHVHERIANMRIILGTIVTGGSDYDITTHCPAYIRQIGEYLNDIKLAEEKIKMLYLAMDVLEDGNDRI